jgi:hypothetical protein
MQKCDPHEIYSSDIIVVGDAGRDHGSGESFVNPLNLGDFSVGGAG